MPSMRQPSPAKTYVWWPTISWPGRLNSAASRLSASAMPTALARPWPSGPVVVSTPGVTPNSGWPGVLLCSWEALELLERQVVAGQVQQRVQQHRAVPVREYEAVAVDPVRIGRVVLQVPAPERLGNLGHAHRHAGVTVPGSLHGIDREEAQGVAQQAAPGELRSQLGIHAGSLLLSSGASLEIHQAQDHGRENELHGESHESAGHHDVVRPAHPRVLQHGDEIGKVDASRAGEADHHHRLLGARNVAGNEGVARVHGRHALEVDVRAAELRADVVHVVWHAAQDCVDHGLLAVAAVMLVAMDLLDPLEVDDRHDADQQVDVTRHIHVPAEVSPVQALVEQQVAALPHRLPVGEGAGLAAELPRLRGIVHVAAHLAAACGAVLGEGILQLAQEVPLGPEMADGGTRAALGGLHPLAHLDAAVAVQGIALDDLRLDAFAPEDVREALHHRGGARAGGAGDGDDRMLYGHVGLPRADPRPRQRTRLTSAPRAGTASAR